MAKVDIEYLVMYSNTGEGTLYTRSKDYGMARQLVEELKNKIHYANLTISKIWINEVRTKTIYTEDL